MIKSKPQSIIARASCRVDLAGGTLDLWPLYLFHPGAVTVNFALDVMTYCRITPKRSGEIWLKSLDTGKEDRFANVAALLRSRTYKHPLAGYLCRFFLGSDERALDGFSLQTHSDSPAGAGISGSSALMIATTAALARFAARKLSKEEIRTVAQNVEAQLIKVPTGCQDYYPALYGGVSAIHLAPDGVHREQIPVPAGEINSRFLLAYTGAPRQSGINNWKVFKGHINGDKRIFSNFADISSIAQSMRSALMKQDWRDVARLLDEEWTLRKTNAPGITTPLIDKLVAAAMNSGGRAAKVCGAGGGGCVIFFVEPDAKRRLSKVIAANGGQILPFQLATKGLSVQIE